MTPAYAIGITHAVPKASVTAKIAHDMFLATDSRGLGSVSSAEFVAWAKTSVISQGLLSAFKAGCPDLLVDKKKLRAVRAEGKPKV